MRRLCAHRDRVYVARGRVWKLSTCTKESETGGRSAGGQRRDGERANLDMFAFQPRWLPCLHARLVPSLATPIAAHAAVCIDR